MVDNLNGSYLLISPNRRKIKRCMLHLICLICSDWAIIPGTFKLSISGLTNALTQRNHLVEDYNTVLRLFPDGQVYLE